MAVIQGFSSVLSFPYNAVLQPDGKYDRLFDADNFALDRAAMLSDGVFVNPSDNFQVQAQSGNMNIVIGQTARPNTAFVRGRTFTALGQMVLSVPAASTQYTRLDIVTIRHSNLSEVRRIDIHYRVGTPSNVPAAPALIRNADEWEIQLAQITVPANATTISQSNISDTRLNTNLCGIVTYLGQQVDTTSLYIQLQDYLNKMVTEWTNMWDVTKTNQDNAWTTQYNGQRTQFTDWFNGAQTDLTRAVQFIFDNNIMLPGTAKESVFSPDRHTITENIVKTAGSVAVARRVTFIAIPTITENFTLWQTDGTTVQMSTVKTINIKTDGVTETVV